MSRKLPQMEKQDEECDALSEVTNFIAQEIYKLAAIKQFPEECSRICSLSQLISHRLAHLFEQGFDSELEALKNELLNLIVFGATRNDFEAAVGDILREDIEELLTSCKRKQVLVSEVKNASFDYEAHEREIKVAAFDVAREVFSKNRGFKSQIPHKYPPCVFGYRYDYLVALEYLYGLSYHSQLNERTNTITVIRPPYESFRPYAKKIFDQCKCIEKQFPVPDTALSKQTGPIQCDSEDALEAWMAMSIPIQDQPFDIVSKNTELRFKLDLTEPLTNDELDRVLARLRSQISVAQYHNSVANMLLAESEAELIKAHKTPRLETVNFLEMKRLHKASLPDLNSVQQAKAYLCGLIFISEHFLRTTQSENTVTFTWGKNEDGLSTLARYGSISVNLSKIHGEEGFSAGSIESGYKLVKKVFSQHLREFQFGRVQFNTRLNSQQKAKLKSIEPVRLERLHPDDLSRVQELIAKHKEKGRLASVKPQSNGSYVITW